MYKKKKYPRVTSRAYQKMLYRWTTPAPLLLDVGGGAQDVEPLQDHADGAQLAVHPLQSPLPRHLVDETQPLNTLAL